MKKILSLCMILCLSSFLLVAQEFQPLPFSAGINIGGQTGLSPINTSAPEFYTPSVVQLHGKYMLSDNFGLMARAQYNDISLNDGDINSNFIKTTFHGVYNIGHWFGLSQKLQLNLHTGFGFAALWRPDLPKTPSPVFDNADEMIIWDLGFNPTIALNEKFSLNIDYTYASHMLQDRPYEMNSLSVSPWTDGNMMTLTVGVSWHFGEAKSKAKEKSIQKKLEEKEQVENIDNLKNAEEELAEEKLAKERLAEKELAEKNAKAAAALEKERVAKENAMRLKNLESKLPKFENVQFSYGSSKLTPVAKKQLNKIIDYLNANLEVNIEIHGYTDCSGSAKYNELLSQRRAGIVSNYLASHGIADHRISANGFGEDNLISDCKDSKLFNMTNNAINRRVEFELKITQ